ncbi:MAG: 3-hydroxyacyl-CoA dehydrogenase NAD-binding domain-containing protein [Bacteroidia bacterium]|nr:3-hydroxyacyl-CoA dehydrogenase NAD-binding domain-containing protein [Bacteroidia bacterium]
MKYKIKKVAVLGSGVMGSRIACHFANIGVQVLLLDIVPNQLLENEQAKGLTLDNKLVRNRIVNEALQNVLKANPSPVYHSKVAERITTGNFIDDMKDIAHCDWILEAVVENLEIKKQVFSQVEQFRTAGTIVTTNTSGIPIHSMLEGRSDDFKTYFCGTHFFNPPRYLKLLEVIPTEFTRQEVVDFMMEYGDKFLGKITVLCKDTPAFIANRIGVYSIMEILHAAKKLNLTVEEVDKLTGPVVGRPKSATFRTADVVGIDTLIKVATNLVKDATSDESKYLFELPDYVKQMDANKWYGDKSKQGFYKKIKNVAGETEILSLNLNTFEYGPQQKTKFHTLEATKPIDDLAKRFPVLLSGKDKAGDFYRDTFYGAFAYITNRIPEIADAIYQIDEAVCAGFGWEMGPFEIWDSLGVAQTLELIKQHGRQPASWVDEMIASGATSFYKLENSVRKYYDIKTKTYKPLPGSGEIIILDHIRNNSQVWKNSGATLHDLGDGVLNLEFQTKMNTMGSEIVAAINKSIDIAEQDFRGLVIGNNGQNFSAGANLAMLLMFAIDQEFDEIDLMVRMFQKTMMRVRYSAIPVVTAPHGLSLGGGCEINLHADAVQASAETYIGLVEMGVGLIPGGGGTKEMTLRASDAYEKGDIELNTLQNAYMNIAMAKVATSAYEAYDMGILRNHDLVSINQRRQIADAKQRVLQLAEAGYTQPIQRKDVKVQGKAGLAMFYIGAASMRKGQYISDHDQKISQKLAWIMCGGDLSYPQYVSEQYLLDLEREAFLSLCGERKTLERIQHTLRTGKPLRN